MRKRNKIISVLLGAALCLGMGGCDRGQDDGVSLAAFPLYREDTLTMEYTDKDYKERENAPYWLGNVIYNETALPITFDTDGGGVAYAKLMYEPERVISVKDYKLGTTYVEGVDYTVDKAKKRLVIPETSSIPKLYDGVENGEHVPNGYELGAAPDHISKYVVWDLGKGPFIYTEAGVFYTRYLSVTYSYDVSDLPKNVFGKFDRTSLTDLRRKLENKEDISLAVIGDSITEGFSSTGKLGVEPYAPCYAERLKAEIERVYGVNVTLTNAALSGSVSEWILSGEGAASLGAVKSAKPDLCVIAYGMNDAHGTTPPVSAASFGTNIEDTVRAVRGASPDCSFILVNSFPCNPKYERVSGMFDEYLEKLEKIALSYGDGSVKVVDMHAVGEHMLSVKRYCEISSSNANHPNDYFHRIYAENIMSVICDYKQ